MKRLNTKINASIIAVICLLFLSACTTQPLSTTQPPITSSPQTQDNHSSSLFTTWNWLSTTTAVPETFEPKTPGEFSITLQNDNTISVQTDCNNASGIFSLTEGTPSITFSEFAMPRKFCEDSLETTFINHLKSVYSHEIIDDQLRLHLSANQGFMTFHRQ